MYEGLTVSVLAARPTTDKICKFITLILFLITSPCNSTFLNHLYFTVACGHIKQIPFYFYNATHTATVNLSRQLSNFSQSDAHKTRKSTQQSRQYSPVYYISVANINVNYFFYSTSKNNYTIYIVVENLFWWHLQTINFTSHLLFYSLSESINVWLRN